MKQSRIIVIILLVVLMVGGWGSALFGAGNEENKEYNLHIESAEDYMKRGLYQKAVKEYEAAISVKDTQENWESMLKAYDNRYKEDSEIYDDYLNAAKQAVSLYNTNADFVMILANLYLDRDEYMLAYKCLNQAVTDQVKDKKLEELRKEVQYSYETEWGSFTAYSSYTNGIYAVCSSEKWFYIAEDGTDKKVGEFDYAGPVGADGIRLVCQGKKTTLIDNEKMVQGITDINPEKAGVYSEGLIPILSSGSYSYYDSLGDKKFGEYQQAGSFQNGKAAVETKDGEWQLIDTKGKAASANRYEDIRLNPDATYFKNGIMLAKKDKEYQMLNEEEKPVNKFSCEDIDVVTDDGIIAFCKDDKWGFVDLEGKEVIKPAYKAAKSFSNGLAAVSDGEKWGFINTDGELVIDYIFFDTDYFNTQGSCIVGIGPDVWQLISLYVWNEG